MDEPLTTVGIFSTPVEAEMARNRLEESGIPAFVVDAETVGMLFHFGGALGGVKVQVAESDAERAREILAAREGRAALSTDDDYGVEDRIQAGDRPRLRHSAARRDEEDEGEADEPRSGVASRAVRVAVVGFVLFGLLALLLVRSSGERQAPPPRGQPPAAERQPRPDAVAIPRF
jgi:hypothetical protein